MSTSDLNQITTAMSLIDSLRVSQQCIDLEIDKITTAFEKAKQRLGFQRNEHALINALLPSELLSRIFQEVVNIAIEKVTNAPRQALFWGKDPFRTAIEWLPTISHVCSYWRTIALSTPSLWTSYFPPTLDGLQAFMDRSRSSLLDLHLSFHKSMPGMAERWKLLRPHMWRVRNLDLEANCTADYLPFPEEQRAIRELLRHTPSSVESISLEFDRELGFRDEFFLASAMRPFQRSHGEEKEFFPYLRHVYFCFFPFNWKCGILRNLHTLTIIDDIDAVQLWFVESEPQDLFDIIEACPQLHYLKLEVQVRSYIHCIQRDDGSRIPMTCLREAFLSEALGGPFLSRFTLPAATRIVLHGVVVNVRDSTMVLDAVSDLLSRRGMPITELNVGTQPRSDNSACERFELRAHLSSHIPRATAVKQSSGFLGIFATTADIDICIWYVPPINIDTDGLIGAIFKRNMPHLLKLNTDFAVPPLPSCWTSMFNKTPFLRFLVYQGHSGLEHMISALSSTGGDASHSVAQIQTASSIQPRFLLPALLELEIIGDAFPHIGFAFSDEDEDTDPDEIARQALVLQLIEWLQTRWKNGRGIHILRLPSRQSIPSQMRALEIFMKINWGWPQSPDPDWSNYSGSSPTSTISSPDY